MYLNEFDESFDYQTAELVFVYIKQLKTWKNQCVSLHPNVDCVLAVNVDDEIPCVNVFEKNEFDLFQKHNLNVKVFVGEMEQERLLYWILCVKEWMVLRLFCVIP